MILSAVALTAASFPAPAVAGKREQAVPVGKGFPVQMMGSLGKRVIFSGTKLNRRGQPKRNRPDELWRSNGKRRGTKPIYRFAASGAELGGPGFVSNATTGGKLIFSADDGVHGREWWATDGTPRGTRMLADLAPGEASSVDGADLPIEAGGTIFLPTSTEALGREWWRTDGTPRGTQLIEDINPGPGSSHRSFFEIDRIAAGGLLYFTATPGDFGSTELWRSDGTAEGTFSLGLPMNRGALRGGEHQGELFFVDVEQQRGFDGDDPNNPQPGDATEPVQMYRSDGTPRGTRPYFQLPTELGPPRIFGSAGGRLLFFGNNLLWAGANGERPEPIQRLEGIAGRGQYRGSELGFNVGDQLFLDVFEGTGPSDFGIVPWLTDGTEAGTAPVEGVSGQRRSGDAEKIDGRAVISQTRRDRAVLLSTLGPPESTRKIKVKRALQIEHLAIVDPVGAGGKTYFSGFPLPFERRNAGLWMIKHR